MLIMLEIETHSELDIGKKQRKTTWPFPQNNVCSSRRKDQEVSDYTELCERGKQDLLIECRRQALSSQLSLFGGAAGGKFPESSNPKKEGTEAREGTALEAGSGAHGMSQGAQRNATGNVAGRRWRGGLTGSMKLGIKLPRYRQNCLLRDPSRMIIKFLSCCFYQSQSCREWVEAD